MSRFSLAFILMAYLVSCTTDDSSTALPDQTEGFAPVYATPTDITQISIEAARSTEVPGKIYAIKSFIFQNEINKGIHIIDNTDKTNPKKVAFLKVPYSAEIAVKGNFLYTNNLNDLVVFDISNLSKPQLVKRIEKVFPAVNQKYPPVSNTAFECPDPSKGLVVLWERRMLKTPKCRR